VARSDCSWDSYRRTGNDHGFNAHNGVKIDRGEGKGRAGAPWLGVPDFSNILIILRKSCYITILFVMVNAN
jgi:hypothetical protein